MQIADEIAKLKALHSAGALSDEEFTRAKARLLRHPVVRRAMRAIVRVTPVPQIAPARAVTPASAVRLVPPDAARRKPPAVFCAPSDARAAIRSSAVSAADSASTPSCPHGRGG